MADYNIRDFGAVGDGQTNDAAAIQQAIDACGAAGGGRVIVPAGNVYRAGTFAMKSNVELHVERGAILAASGNAADFQTISNPQAYIAFITAEGAENVAISGGGVIDGGGQHFITERLPYIYRMNRARPFTLFFINCRQVTMRDITFRDGAVWTARLTGCQDVVIHAIRILNDLMVPNCDGIDIDHCRNVRISDCHIESGDDCICLKTCGESGASGACENVTVTGCTLVSTSTALNIGCEAHAPMRNVVFDSCVIQATHRGLGIHLSHESDVENVIFSNMIVETRIFERAWWGQAEPIYVVALPWTAEDQIGHIRHVRFSNILCRGENGVFILGAEQDRIEDIVLSDVRVEINKTSKWPGGQQDLRPCPGEMMPEHPTVGFYIKNATNVTLRNCEVAWGENRPDYFQAALESENVAGLTLENFKGESAHPGKYAAVVRG